MPPAVRRTARGLGAGVVAALLVTGLAGCNGSGSDSTSTAAALHGRSATVPLHIAHAGNSTLALARVTIDGKGPFTFAVDTGASTSLVDATVAKRLDLSTQGSSTVNGVSCSTTVSHAVLDHWSVGSLTLPKTTVAVTNLPGKQGGLQGLLGSDVLHEFGVVTIDYDAGKLGVGKAAGQSGATTSVPLKVVTSTTGATLALVSVRLQGQGPFRFALDTGAATTTVATATARKVGLHVTKAPGTVEGVACTSQHSRAPLPRWQVGSLPLPATTVDVVDMAHGQGMPTLQGLLGSNILATFGRITVDYAGQRLVVPAQQSGSPSASTSATGSALNVPLQVQRAGGTVLALTKVSIRGHGPFTFAVDTGAPQSVIATSVAKAVGLTRTGPSHTLHGVMGSASGYPAKVAQWSAASVHLPAATVVVTDLPVQQVDGLIGADVLAHYGAVGIDYSDQVLRLGSAVNRPPNARIVPLKVISGLAGVRVLAPVTVSGHKQAFALDTGASQSALDQGIAKQLGLPTVGHQTDAGVTKRGTAPLVKVSHWSLGAIDLPAGTLLALPLQHQNIAAGLLGSDVLSSFGTVIVDFGRSQLVLPPA